MQIPTLISNDWPLPSNAKNLPLEKFVPQYLLLFSTHLPNIMVQQHSPIVTALKSEEQSFTVVTHNAENLEEFPEFQHFTSFNNFIGRRSNIGAEEMENLQKVYLLLSWFQKCNQVVVGFGLATVRAIKTHQMTFNGERVVGWIIQNGVLRADYPVPGVRIVDVKSLEAEPQVEEAVKTGKTLPAGASESGKWGRGHGAHLWMSFVTESGRIFDLDLSLESGRHSHIFCTCT